MTGDAHHHCRNSAEISAQIHNDACARAKRVDCAIKLLHGWRHPVLEAYDTNATAVGKCAARDVHRRGQRRQVSEPERRTAHGITSEREISSGALQVASDEMYVGARRPTQCAIRTADGSEAAWTDAIGNA